MLHFWSEDERSVLRRRMREFRPGGRQNAKVRSVCGQDSKDEGRCRRFVCLSQCLSSSVGEETARRARSADAAEIPPES